MTNCEPPPESTQIDCNTAIFEKNILDTVESIEIDGEVIEAKTYKRVIYGKYHNGEYQYFTPPKERPMEIF